MNPERIYVVIDGPVVSEKASLAAERGNQVVFKVAKDASKPEIKAAVEKIWNVKVESVRVLIRKGKTKRTRHGLGKQKDVKKAYVKLAEGHDIDFASMD